MRVTHLFIMEIFVFGVLCSSSFPITRSDVKDIPLLRPYPRLSLVLRKGLINGNRTYVLSKADFIKSGICVCVVMN